MYTKWRRVYLQKSESRFKVRPQNLCHAKGAYPGRHLSTQVTLQGKDVKKYQEVKPWKLLPEAPEAARNVCQSCTAPARHAFQLQLILAYQCWWILGIDVRELHRISVLFSRLDGSCQPNSSKFTNFRISHDVSRRFTTFQASHSRLSSPSVFGLGGVADATSIRRLALHHRHGDGLSVVARYTVQFQLRSPIDPCI